MLDSPYAAPREIVYAVAPLRNESGVSLANELIISDTLVSEIDQARGITALPMNRTLAGMRALKIADVSSPAHARALAKALGADAVIVGSITAYHPYDPPVIGLSVGLFGVSEHIGAPPQTAPGLQPEALRTAVRETAAPTETSKPTGPLSAVAAVYDASVGPTRDLVRAYAQGRHDPTSALGWERYTASMALYTRFACFETARQLLDSERRRVAPPEAAQEQDHARR
ncbi:MAG: hypothetical protein SFZ24_02180 [Planctomycetota bacterium]|nr:hypothetical protein [Planctomycetota bacterium]